MADRLQIEALHRRLVNERRKIVETAAEADTLPPAKFLAYLADMDSAIVAVEAVLEDRTDQQASTVTSCKLAMFEAFA